MLDALQRLVAARHRRHRRHHQAWAVRRRRRRRQVVALRRRRRRRAWLVRAIPLAGRPLRHHAYAPVALPQMAHSTTGPPVKRFGPSNKMKQLHWEKLPEAQVAKTVWAQRKIDQEYYKRELDFKEFENLFAAKLKQTVAARMDSWHQRCRSRGRGGSLKPLLYRVRCCESSGGEAGQEEGRQDFGH